MIFECEDIFTHNIAKLPCREAEVDFFRRSVRRELRIDIQSSVSRHVQEDLRTSLMGCRTAHGAPVSSTREYCREIKKSQIPCCSGHPKSSVHF